MKYLSVCSGIEAASMAWHSLGWEPVGFSEIEKFPSQVLATRFPGVKNYGDMTKFREWDIERGTIDLLVGGTPCQAFSVAGLRKGLSDPRGNLALTFVAMVDHYRPEWVVWENVPGVLSSNGGRDFGAFLGALGELGYGWSYRVLDAQYFGVAQRRRRVFVVAHASGDARRAAEVLFEPSCLRGDPPPRREAREGIAGDATQGTGRRLWDTVGTLCVDTHPVLPETVNAITASMANSCLGHNKDENIIAIDAFNQSLTGNVSKTVASRDDQDTASLIAVYESHPNDSRVTGPVEQCPTVAARWGTGGNNTPLVQQPIAFTQNTRDEVRYINGDGSIVGALSAQSGTKQTNYIQQPMAFTHSGYSNQPAWITGDRTDCLSAGGHSDTSHQGIGIIESVQQPMAMHAVSESGDISSTLRTGWNADVHNVVSVQQPIGLDPEHNAIVDGYGTLRAHTSGGFEGNVAVPVQQPMAMRESGQGYWMQDEVIGTIRAEGENRPSRPSNVVAVQQPIAMINMQGSKGNAVAQVSDQSFTLNAMHGHDVHAVAVQQPMAFQSRASATNSMNPGVVVPTLDKGKAESAAVFSSMAVRRLTPVECERLQGFPDGWTDIKPGGKDTPDSPRYKALGNSMAVPVMRWIGKRIEAHK